jgi:hypothetical protein
MVRGLAAVQEIVRLAARETGADGAWELEPSARQSARCAAAAAGRDMGSC